MLLGDDRGLFGFFISQLLRLSIGQLLYGKENLDMANNNYSPSIGMSLWVVEGVIDFPTYIEINSDEGISLNLGDETEDGFVQLRPIDEKRTTLSTYWSMSEPISYDCRGLVRAPSSWTAMLRGGELFEHVADRFTLWSGFPVRVLSIGFVYNEEMLRSCIAGEIKEYEATSGGEVTWQIRPPMNSQLNQLLHPPLGSLEAIRWFRLGLLANRKLEQYLFYYISLESISEQVPGVERGVRRDKSGNEIEGELESHQNAAIKYLISRHTNLKSKTKKTLSRIRGRIAHGNTDLKTVKLAAAYLPIIQRLAMDGISLSCDVDPENSQIMQPSKIEMIAPVLSATYIEEENPTIKWGGLLSDNFSTYMKRIKNY